MPSLASVALSARASACARATASGVQIIPAWSLMRACTSARTLFTLLGLSGRNNSVSAATPASATAAGTSPAGGNARPPAAICSPTRVPKTWPALSAAPPGRVTPCVPAASPTA